MLVGKVYYKKAGDSVFYDLEGCDNSAQFKFTISTHNADGINYMANSTGANDDDALWDRTVELNSADIKVETLVKVDPNTGKRVKAPVNSDFFCRLGAIFRYIKSECRKENEIGYTGLRTADNEFNVNTLAEYEINFPGTDKKLAKVVLNYGEFEELHFETDDFKVDFQDDGLGARLLPSIKNKFVKFGIRFNTEYLGFNIPEQVVTNTVEEGGMYENIEQIIEANPNREFRWLLGKDYRIVTDETLDEICDYIKNWDGYVFYDTETTGLKINFKSRIGQADQLVGVVLSVKYGESFFFPTKMKSIKNLCNGDDKFFMEKYMRPILEGKPLVAHNGSFDWKVAYIYDINANIVHDTMLLIQLTLGNSHKRWKLGLKDNAKTLLHRDSLELSDLVKDNQWGENDIRFWDLPYELVRLYACADTDNTNGLLAYAEKADLLNKYNAQKVYGIEVTFSLAVAYQEFYGHRIDVKNLDIIRKDIGEGQARVMKQMVEIAGHEFNPNSPKQLIKIMYDELKMPVLGKSKSGNPSTDKETLKSLASMEDLDGNVKYPFARCMQEFRDYEGVRKIIDKFPEVLTDDGFAFSSVLQMGAATGRVSITNPNYQSYNDPIKKNVIPREGFYMFDTDYSSVEYRVLGNVVGNKRIMESFKDPDFDYHQYQAARMYGVPYSAVNKKMRKAAKGINFGLPYGMGDASLGARVFGDRTPENTQKAASLRSAYFKGQEDIRDWFEYHRNKGVNEGFTETFFGRRRYYFKESESEAKIRREAGNFVIQGCISYNTLIQTKECGIVPIGSVCSSNVHLWDGKDWTIGTIVYSGKKQKCIVTFADDTEFICSPTHKFLLVGKDPSDIGNYVECKDLTDKHFIECNTSTESSLTKFSRATKKIAVKGGYAIGLKVKSVEITDEYIDMYDVMNTERGYYVSDGIITHNCAADIYKMAVGRVFQRISKEGWLGKVLFSGFIHDELLGEVSTDINPMVFLKMLREEFEVKVSNPDGTPWCPLYMGFGFGTSWYEAKSVELPIKLQWEFVKKYGDNGYPDWDGDARKFCDNIPNLLRDFDVRDIRNQLLDKDSQGKEIKPTLNNQIISCLKEDKDCYNKALNEYFGDKPHDYSNEADIVAYLNSKYHIQSLMKDEEGNVVEDFELPGDKTQENITLYCQLHDTDRTAIDIHNIEVSDEKKAEEVTMDFSDVEDDEVSAEYVEKKRTEQIFAQVAHLGMAIDDRTMTLYLNFDILNFVGFDRNIVLSKLNKEGNGYPVVFLDLATGKKYGGTAWLDGANFTTLQQIYLNAYKIFRK